MPALPQAASVDLRALLDIDVWSEPNPVREVKTTTFRAAAAYSIDEILVQIFDQTGALVFEEESPGDELVWHTDNEYGEYLANGVYLYQVMILIEHIWYPSGVEKLVILR